MTNCNTWVLADPNGKKQHIRPVTLTLFQQCTTIVCEDVKTEEQYRLYFYKKDFLAACPIQKAKKSSFLKQAERKGISLHAPSPLFTLFQLPTFHLTSLKQLLSRLHHTYSPVEATLIHSYFDTEIERETIDSYLKEQFFNYRRNGQLNHAYRLAKVLDARGYESDWLKASLTHPDYAKAAHHYDKPLSGLATTDPIYAEQQSFLKENYTFLFHLYEQEARVAHAIIIRMTQCKKTPTPKHYTMLKDVLRSQATIDLLPTLFSFLPYVPVSTGLHQDAYQQLLKQQDYQQALTILLTYSFPLSDEERKELPKLTEYITVDKLTIPIEAISHRTFAFFKDETLFLNILIKTLITQHMTTLTLGEIMKWLTDCNTINLSLPIIDQLNEMIELTEDPEQQMKLGIHYYELNHYEKAIDCFSWEQELDPNNLEPLRWLIKCYQHIGKQLEADTYQQLMMQLQKSS